MRRVATVRLSPDEHCAVHHFIRVHGRRPTADELRSEVLVASAARPHPRGVLLGRVRCRLAGLLARL